MKRLSLYFTIFILASVITASHLDQRAQINRLQNHLITLARNVKEGHKVLENRIVAQMMIIKTLEEHQYEIEELKCLTQQ